MGWDIKVNLKARIVRLVLRCLEAFRTGLIFRAAEHPRAPFLLTAEISMRHGGCLKEAVCGGNSGSEYLWVAFFCSTLFL